MISNFNLQIPFNFAPGLQRQLLLLQNVFFELGNGSNKRDLLGSYKMLFCGSRTKAENQKKCHNKMTYEAVSIQKFIYFV